MTSCTKCTLGVQQRNICTTIAVQRDKEMFPSSWNHFLNDVRIFKYFNSSTNVWIIQKNSDDLNFPLHKQYWRCIAISHRMWEEDVFRNRWTHSINSRKCQWKMAFTCFKYKTFSILQRHISIASTTAITVLFDVTKDIAMFTIQVTASSFACLHLIYADQKI